MLKFSKEIFLLKVNMFEHKVDVSSKTLTNRANHSHRRRDDFNSLYNLNLEFKNPKHICLLKLIESGKK